MPIITNLSRVGFFVLLQESYVIMKEQLQIDKGKFRKW